MSLFNLLTFFSDKKVMDFSQLLQVCKQVLTDKRVIIVTIILILYVALVKYVVRYRKKPPKVRKAHILASPKPQVSQEEEVAASEVEE